MWLVQKKEDNLIGNWHKRRHWLSPSKQHVTGWNRRWSMTECVIKLDFMSLYLCSVHFLTFSIHINSYHFAPAGIFLSLVSAGHSLSQVLVSEPHVHQTGDVYAQHSSPLPAFPLPGNAWAVLASPLLTINHSEIWNKKTHIKYRENKVWWSFAVTIVNITSCSLAALFICIFKNFLQNLLATRIKDTVICFLIS